MCRVGKVQPVESDADTSAVGALETMRKVLLRAIVALLSARVKYSEDLAARHRGVAFV